jgi:NAD+ kinase
MIVMKAAVVGHARKLIEEKLPEFGLELDEKNPDVVISFGGDGTALYGERVYPGIPRIMIKHSKICMKCKEHDFSKVLNMLRVKRYNIKNEIKVEVVVNDDPNKKLIGLNEVGIHHKIPTKALRLRIKVNGKIIEEEQISDGLIVASPYGSTAYFYSICRKKFSKGLGIAFKNPKSGRRYMVVNDDSIIEIEVLRGIGLVAADNDEKMFEVMTGDKILIKKAKEKARIIEIREKRRIRV